MPFFCPRTGVRIVAPGVLSVPGEKSFPATNSVPAHDGSPEHDAAERAAAETLEAHRQGFAPPSEAAQQAARHAALSAYVKANDARCELLTAEQKKPEEPALPAPPPAAPPPAAPPAAEEGPLVERPKKANPK